MERFLSFFRGERSEDEEILVSDAAEASEGPLLEGPLETYRRHTQAQIQQRAIARTNSAPEHIGNYFLLLVVT